MTPSDPSGPRKRVDLRRKAALARGEVVAGRRRRVLGAAPIASEPVATRRPRLDLSAAAAGASARLDGRPRRARAGAPAAPDVRAEPAAPKVRIIAAPAAYVVAVPDAPGGRLSDHDRELLGAARRLADAVEGAVVAVAAATAAEVAAAGADRHVALDATEDYDPEGRAVRLAAVANHLSARHLLFPATAEGQDLALRLAAALGEPPMTGVVALRPDEAVRPLAGAREQVRTPPRIMTLAPGAVAPTSEPGEARDLAIAAPEPHPRRLQDLGMVAADAAAVPLEEAPLILSGGAGVRDWPRFLRLAEHLGAAPAGSRVVCDEGHLPRDRQVGVSGCSVSADCYLALGISGAVQHIQGLEACTRVVAVNTDPHAPIAKRADLMIVGDADAVVTALLDRLEGARA